MGGAGFPPVLLMSRTSGGITTDGHAGSAARPPMILDLLDGPG
jgi:hypothetical protein